MSIKIPTLESLNTKIKGTINETPYRIDDLTKYKGRSYLFVCNSIVPCGSITLPKYTTGLVIEQNYIQDAVIWAIDPARNLYIGYRNGNEWSCRRL